eukprot:COSAG01_NODE_72356_length_253_cov_0.675325_1_plen_41_part_10
MKFMRGAERLPVRKRLEPVATMGCVQEQRSLPGLARMQTGS